LPRFYQPSRNPTRFPNITASKFYGWRERYGKVNEHNGWVPRDFWLEEWEKRWHKSLKAECIRPGTPLSLEDAQRLVEGYVEHYNNVRLNSAIGYITPKDMLAGHRQEIQTDRDRKLEAAREQRKNRRQRAA
jgi:transposase InsO family protein